MGLKASDFQLLNGVPSGQSLAAESIQVKTTRRTWFG